MDWKNFLIAYLIVVGIHILLGLFAMLDNGYFILGVFAPQRFLLNLLRDDGSRFTISGSVIYYLNDICIQSCERCEFLCYPKENLRIVCNEIHCGLESDKGRRILENGEKPYFIVKDGIIFENAAFLCNRNESFCSINIELEKGIFYDIHLPDAIPFYND